MHLVVVNHSTHTLFVNANFTIRDDELWTSFIHPKLIEIIHSSYFMEIIHSRYLWRSFILFFEIIHSPYFKETIHSSNFMENIHPFYFMESYSFLLLCGDYSFVLFWRLFIHPFCEDYSFILFVEIISLRGQLGYKSPPLCSAPAVAPGCSCGPASRWKGEA
jgi:hypothetical protein